MYCYISPQVISLASDRCALASAFIHSGQSGDITDATVPFWPIRTFRRYYALWGHAIGDRGAAFRDRIMRSHFGKQLLECGITSLVSICLTHFVYINRGLAHSVYHIKSIIYRAFTPIVQQQLGIAQSNL